MTRHDVKGRAMDGRAGKLSRIAGVVLYGLMALALTYPLVLHFDSAVISHWKVDIEHGLWVQWWFETALESPDLDLFETPFLQFPATVDLQLADINLAVNAVFYLLASAAGRIVAYNLLSLAAFVLSAWLMSRLVCRLSGSLSAAWMAGVFYAASSYWLASLINAWMYLIHIWVLPLVLLSFRSLSSAGPARMWRWLLVGLSLGLTFHVTPYYFLYALTLLVLLAPWYTAPIANMMRDRRDVGGLVAGIAVMLSVVLPRAVPMALASARHDYVVHHGPMNTVLGARLPEMWMPSAGMVEGRLSAVGFLVVFLGYTLCTVIALGLWTGKRRSEQASWLVSGVVFLIFSLGPAVEIGGTRVPLPGYLLQRLPGFSGTTNHWRWTLPALCCLAVAAGLSLASLQSYVRRKRWARGLHHAVVPAVLVLHLAELFLVFPLPRSKPLFNPAPAPIATRLRDVDAVEVVVDITRRSKLNQIGHHKTIVGGWLPRLDKRFAAATQRFDHGLNRIESLPERVQFLGERGIQAVILDPERALILSPDKSAAGRYRATAITAEDP